MLIFGLLYIIFFVEKMDKLYFGLKFVCSHENLLYLRMVVENFVFVKTIDFACLFERLGLFAVYILTET